MTKVIFYSTKTGKKPVNKFINSLNKIQKNKIVRILQNIQEYGLLSVIPHTKKLTGTPFWEIRILGKDNIRVVYVSLLKIISIRYKDWLVS